MADHARNIYSERDEGHYNLEKKMNIEKQNSQYFRKKKNKNLHHLIISENKIMKLAI